MIFERGYYTGDGSNYSDYTRKSFDLLAEELISFLGLTSAQSLLDFGCATGGLLHALIQRAITNVTGTDISYWAIKFGRKEYGFSPQVLQHYNRQLLEDRRDVILMLDVLEHIPLDELEEVLSVIRAQRLVVRVPVSAKEGEDFVLEVSKNDKTHVQIHAKSWWEDLLVKYNFSLEKILQGRAIYDSPGVLARVYKGGT